MVVRKFSVNMTIIAELMNRSDNGETIHRIWVLFEESKHFVFFCVSGLFCKLLLPSLEMATFSSRERAALLSSTGGVEESFDFEDDPPVPPPPCLHLLFTVYLFLFFSTTFYLFYLWWVCACYDINWFLSFRRQGPSHRGRSRFIRITPPLQRYFPFKINA